METALAAGAIARAVPATETTHEHAPTRKKPRIMFFHDARHPAIYMYEPPMEKEEFEAAVDELAGTSVEALMFGLGDGRTMFHDTKVGEVWGDPVDKWNHVVFRRAAQNARMMLDSNRDPLRIVCERARDMGILIYPTLLVNQARRAETREDDVRSSDFRWDNTHLEIDTNGDLEGFEGATNLDFKHAEVRDERFALIDEVLRNYPIDGFELQLNYRSEVTAFFHPKEVAAGRTIMTSWVKRVFEAVKAGHPERELVIRVPADIEQASSLGLDVRAWIRQGIVDVVAAETYAYQMDPLADFRPLVEAAKDSDCRIHAALKTRLSSDRLDNGTIEFIRSTACNYWAQGIDGLYLDQWFTVWPYDSTFYEQLREVGHPHVMAYKDKTYFVPTRTRPQDDTPLPRELHVNRPVRVKLPIADDLPRWDRVGRVHEVMLRLRLAGATETDRVEFRLNGKLLPDSQLRKINRVYRMQAPRYRVFGYWFIYRLEPEHWPVQGENQVEVTLRHRDADILPPLHLRDVEFDVKYLGGKNFARGQDPDVGPYVVKTL
jgi:hypothetical protein